PVRFLLRMVPKGGLEPPRPKPLPPQGSASTNSATWAMSAILNQLPAGGGSCCGAGACAGTAGTVSLAAGAASGTAGTCAMTPRSCCDGPCGTARWVAYQAMPMLIVKNAIASHLVLLDRKFEAPRAPNTVAEDRKSTRLNSSHVKISYAVFCLK